MMWHHFRPRWRVPTPRKRPSRNRAFLLVEQLEGRWLPDASAMPPPDPPDSLTDSGMTATTCDAEDYAVYYFQYQSTASTAYATYLAAEAAARAALGTALDAAADNFNSAAELATGSFLGALEGAITAQSDSLMSAFATYEASVAAADATFSEAVGPAEAALTAAQAAYDANPDDPTAWEALQTAQTSWQAAVDAATPAWQAEVDAATEDFEDAQAAALATYSAAESTAQSSFTASLIDAAVAWTDAEREAVEAYKAAEEAALAEYQSAEASAWDTYQLAKVVVLGDSPPEEIPPDPGPRSSASRPVEIAAFRDALVVPSADTAAASALAQAVEVQQAVSGTLAWFSAVAESGGQLPPEGPDSLAFVGGDQQQPPPTPPPGTPARPSGFLPHLPYGPSGAYSITVKNPDRNGNVIRLIRPGTLTDNEITAIINNLDLVMAGARIAGIVLWGSSGAQTPPAGYQTVGPTVDRTFRPTLPVPVPVYTNQGQFAGILIIPVRVDIRVQVRVGISLPATAPPAP